MGPTSPHSTKQPFEKNKANFFWYLIFHIYLLCAGLCIISETAIYASAPELNITNAQDDWQLDYLNVEVKDPGDGGPAGRLKRLAYYPDLS